MTALTPPPGTAPGTLCLLDLHTPDGGAYTVNAKWLGDGWQFLGLEDMPIAAPEAWRRGWRFVKVVEHG